jgi:hypothetical protein
LGLLKETLDEECVLLFGSDVGSWDLHVLLLLEVLLLLLDLVLVLEGMVLGLLLLLYLWLRVVGVVVGRGLVEFGRG